VPDIVEISRLTASQRRARSCCAVRCHWRLARQCEAFMSVKPSKQKTRRHFEEFLTSESRSIVNASHWRASPPRHPTKALGRPTLRNSSRLPVGSRLNDRSQGLSVLPLDPDRVFCVMLHDVAPRWEKQVDIFIETFAPLVGTSMAAAVVPCWGGQPLVDRD